MEDKNVKTEFRYFTVPEWEREQRYLQEQHKNGWKFIKVTGLGRYHFEKCEPEDVVYQLDYNQEGIAHKEEYIQMFRDCGWEYLQDFFGYSYFRKPVAKMNGEEEIFCDDASRTEMMKRVFRGRIIPLLIIFFLIILPQLFLQRGLGNRVVVGMYIALFVLYLGIFAYFGYRFWEYQKNLKK